MSESRVAKATIRDEGLLAALEEAEEEHGSLADALRHAVATTYAGDDDVETVNDTGLPVKAEEGHRKLVEWTGVGGRIELGTAESILANHLNIQKEAIRKVVIQPLKREDVIALHQGIHHVSIVVGKNDDEPTEAESPVEPPTSKEAVADGGEARERLDELAAASTEVADGDE